MIKMGVWVVALLVGMLSSTSHAGQKMALGLIVKLKDENVLTRAASMEVGPKQDHGSALQTIVNRKGISYRWRKRTVFGADVIHRGFPVTLDEAGKDARKLRQDPKVEWVVINEMEVRQDVASPNDPDYAKQTWITDQSSPASPRIPAAWQRLSTLTRSLAPITVAVLDSGVLKHPDLVGRVLFDDGYDFVSSAAYSNDGDGRDADATDPGDFLSADASSGPNSAAYKLCGSGRSSSWHGTMIAGQLIAAANNGLGGLGMLMAFDAPSVLPVRVAGSCGAAVSDIVEGMMWAAGVSYEGMPKANSHPARVLNLSFGGVSDSCTCDLNNGKPTSAACLYQEAIRVVTRKGAVLVAAAGNASNDAKSGNSSPSRPANCPGVLAVTALNKDGGKAQYAFSASKLGIATLGGDPQHGDDGIYSTSNSGVNVPVLSNGSPENFYKSESGTSFSAPIAAGTIAMMWAVNPGLTVAEVLNGLRTHGVHHFPSADAVTRVDPADPAASAASNLENSDGTTTPSDQLFPTVARNGAALPLCTAAETGSCNCTTDSCGAGVLDVDAAVAWAMDQTLKDYAAPDVVATFYGPQAEDQQARPTDGQNKTGGGGGAIGPWDLDILGILAGCTCLGIGRRGHQSRVHHRA